MRASKTIYHPQGDADNFKTVEDTLDTNAASISSLNTSVSGKVDTTTTISAAGLATGGGDLSANRTITVPAASQADAETGTNNANAMTALRVTQAVAKWGHGPDVIVEEQQTSGSAGGTFTSGADQTRVLTTLVRNNGSVASLSTNQVTLPAGTWCVEWTAPAQSCNNHQSFLYNVTDTAEVKRGTTESSNATNGSITRSVGKTVVVLAGAKAFEIRHRCLTTRATFGFGDSGGFGTEVYTRFEATKIA